MSLRGVMTPAMVGVMTPEEIAARTAARTAARMAHLKEVLSPEEWAQVVGGTPAPDATIPDISLDDPDRAAAAALLDEVMCGDHSHDSANAVVAQALKQRALVERQRTLADARAFIERETSAYPGASPAITSGIWGGFDQWAVSEYGALADPVRRLCGECGQRHTQYEYDDAHRNDEGGY